MKQNLNLSIRFMLAAILLLPATLLAQSVVSRDFSYKFEQVSYIGKIRCMDSRVIIRSVLKITPPKGAVLGRYAKQISVSTMESFLTPPILDDSLLWDAMLAKQYITVAQGYFQNGTRYCAVNTGSHKDMLKESQRYYKKSHGFFMKNGNHIAANKVDRLISLIDSIKTNIDPLEANDQFEKYYDLNNSLIQTCVKLGKDYDEQYKCVTLQ